MAKLTKDEAATLKALTEKAEAPDAAPAAGRTLNISIDLGDEAQVKRAVSLGLLEPGEAGDDGGDGDDDGDKGAGDDGDGDEPPRRRSFFPDS